LLYLENAYLRDFEAKILKKVKMDDKEGIVLDATAFYPVGGGQPADVGVIVGRNGEAKVVNVQSRKGVVFHFVDKITGELGEGETVKGKIDWKRRYQLMKNHTAAHLISEAVRRVVGNPIAVVGSAIEIEKARLDLAYEKSIRPLFPEIEKLANQVVEENRPVIISFMPREEAEDYVARFHENLGMLPPSIKTVRVVEIKDWHACACGGTHVNTTGEIGSIKLLRRSSKGKGVERIEFAAL